MRAVSNNVLGATLAAMTLYALVWQGGHVAAASYLSAILSVAGIAALLLMAVRASSLRQHMDILIKMEDAALTQLRKQALLAELGKLKQDMEASPALASTSFSGGLAKLLDQVGMLPEQHPVQETTLYGRIATWRAHAAKVVAQANGAPLPQGTPSRGALLIELTSITRSLEAKG